MVSCPDTLRQGFLLYKHYFLARRRERPPAYLATPQSAAILFSVPQPPSSVATRCTHDLRDGLIWVTKGVSHLRVGLATLGMYLGVALYSADHPDPVPGVHPHAMITPSRPFRAAGPRGRGVKAAPGRRRWPPCRDSPGPLGPSSCGNPPADGDVWPRLGPSRPLRLVHALG